MVQFEVDTGVVLKAADTLLADMVNPANALQQFATVQ